MKARKANASGATIPTDADVSLPADEFDPKHK
jgi:hypothetical protein